MPFWLKHCSGFLEPKLIENPPTHTKVRGHCCGARQTTGGGPSRDQGRRGEVAEATGGHLGGQGNPLGHPSGTGRIGLRHGGRPCGSLEHPGLGKMVPGTWDSRMERMDSTPRPRPSRQCACVTGASWKMLTWPRMGPRSRGWNSRVVMATSRSNGA